MYKTLSRLYSFEATKTVVKWDVDVEQAQDVGFNYLDSQLQVSEAVSLGEEMAPVKTNRKGIGLGLGLL